MAKILLVEKCDDSNTATTAEVLRLVGPRCYIAVKDGKTIEARLQAKEMWLSLIHI